MRWWVIETRRHEMLIHRCGLKVEITQATQYATIYSDDDRPVATLQRARVYAPRGTPNWRMYDTAGIEIGDGYALAGAAVSDLIRIRRELAA
jgi:hypothetical protein